MSRPMNESLFAMEMGAAFPGRGAFGRRPGVRRRRAHASPDGGRLRPLRACACPPPAGATGDASERGEVDRDLALGRLRRVRAVDDVLDDLLAPVTGEVAA